MNRRMIIGEILRKEGWPKFTDDPDDRGGPTKGGITLRTFRNWRGDHSLTAQDLERLEEPEAREIYDARYITQPNLQAIESDWLGVQVIGAGVLHGPRWAVRRLQEITEAHPVDGILGPVTAAAINAWNGESLGYEFMRYRLKKYARICQRDPSQLKWLWGWINRATRYLLDPMLVSSGK